MSLTLYIFIILVDPYDTLNLSIQKKREPIVTNQRYSYPAIAQKDFHDSAIIGTSSIRLLNPSDLNPIFNAKFVNLAMNSATAYEQTAIAKVFTQMHKRINYLIVGVDSVWCDTNNEPEKLTFRPFPPWLYDNNELNDYTNMFTTRALENSVRLIEYWLGKREARYSINGYGIFVGDDSKYDLNKARIKIYGNEKNKFEFQKKLALYKANPKPPKNNVSFPVHEKYLSEIFNDLPKETIKLLVFVPYHFKHYYRISEKMNACKIALKRFSTKYENTHIVDFMFGSDITVEDENYWDVLHYRIHIANRLPELIYKTFTHKKEIPNLTQYLQ